MDAGTVALLVALLAVLKVATMAALTAEQWGYLTVEKKELWMVDS